MHDISRRFTGRYLSVQSPLRMPSDIFDEATPCQSPYKKASSNFQLTRIPH